MDNSKRAGGLQRLADQLERESDALSLALVRDAQVTIRRAREYDVRAAAALLREHRADRPIAEDPSFQLADREPLGKVGILLPSDHVGICAAASIGAAYLAANEVVIRLPTRLPTFARLFQNLLETALPGVVVAQTDARAFLTSCFDDSEMQAIVCFGEDRWLLRYRELARQSRTKVIFEGPRKDPFVVFPDADLDMAAAAAVSGSCLDGAPPRSSPERFYVHEEVAEPFAAAVVERMKTLVIGPPEDEATDIGPIRSPVVLERLKKQINDARTRGARAVHGGEFVKVPGSRYETCEPTVFADCTHEMDLFHQETQGPIVPIATFRTEIEARELIDDTRYGHGASVHGGESSFLEGLHASYGKVFHNTTVTEIEEATTRMPWGGFRNSAWIWEWQEGNFHHREGPRFFVKELSRPSAVARKDEG